MERPAQQPAADDRQRWLETALEMAIALHAPSSLGEAGQEIVARVRDISAASTVALLVGSPGEVVAVAGDLPADWPDAVSRVDGPPGAPRSVALAEERRLVAVPLPTELAPPAELVLVLPDSHALLAETETDVLVTFGAQTALVLDHAEVMREHRALLVLEDRQRIARDLHDQVIQRLYAAGLRLELLRGDLDAGSAASVGDVLDELNLTIGAVRDTVFELERSDGSLAGEVTALVEEYAGVLGLEPELHLDGPLDAVVGAAQRTHLLPVLREALSNVARHADASWVSVRLQAGPVRDGGTGRLRLVVEDDGVGVADDDRGAGSGLRNLDGRARALGGRCTVGSRPRGGVELCWEVPLRPAPPAPRG